MDFRRLGDGELAGFTKNVVNRLTDHEIDCLPDETADLLAAGLALLNDAFEADIERTRVLEAELRSLYASRRTRQPQIIRKLSQVAKTLGARHGTAADYELCGFSPRRSWTRIVAQDPTDLVVTGQPNGVNVLRFKGNNRRGNIRYEIWRRKSRSDEWSLIDTTAKQSFRDSPVVPGQYYEYKVRAAAAKTESNFSDIAVVYPDGPSAKK